MTFMNIGNKPIDELMHYAISHDIMFFLFLLLDIPFDIPVCKPIQELLIKNMKLNPFLDTNRFVAFHTVKDWIESNRIPGRDVVNAKFCEPNTLGDKVIYTSQFNETKILIQVHESEVEQINNSMTDRNFRSSLLMRVLSILEYKLVEIKGFEFGSQFLNFGADRVFLFKVDKELGQIKAINFVITNNYSINLEHKIPMGTDSELSNDDLCIWRYYANRCEISYRNNQNLDCILFAAICIESYINNLLIEKDLLSDYKNHISKAMEYLTQYKNKEISSSSLIKKIDQEKDEETYSNSVYGKIRYLFDKKVIDLDQKSKLKFFFGRINELRNKIVHGDLDSLLFPRDDAETAYNSIVELFTNKEITKID